MRSCRPVSPKLLITVHYGVRYFLAGCIDCVIGAVTIRERLRLIQNDTSHIAYCQYVYLVRLNRLFPGRLVHRRRGWPRWRGRLSLDSIKRAIAPGFTLRRVVRHDFSRTTIYSMSNCTAAASELLYFSNAPSPMELFPAASSLSRAICVQVRRRTGGNPTTPRLASSSGEIGGNPAVPSSEFTSARFSARSRATSSSSSSTYRPRACRPSQVIIDCHMVFSRIDFSLSAFDFRSATKTFPPPKPRQAEARPTVRRLDAPLDLSYSRPTSVIKRIGEHS